MLGQNLPEIENVYVMPSASDESLSIGAALHFYNNNFNNYLIKLVENLIISQAAPGDDLDLELIKIKQTRITKLRFDNTISDILNKNESIAICSGRTRWEHEHYVIDQ